MSTSFLAITTILAAGTHSAIGATVILLRLRRSSKIRSYITRHPAPSAETLNHIAAILATRENRAIRHLEYISGPIFALAALAGLLTAISII